MGWEEGIVYSQSRPDPWRSVGSVVGGSVEARGRAGIEAIVGSILPQLGAVSVWRSNAKKGEEGDGQWQLDAQENKERPLVGSPATREEEFGPGHGEVVLCCARATRLIPDSGR